MSRCNFYRDETAFFKILSLIERSCDPWFSGVSSIPSALCTVVIPSHVPYRFRPGFLYKLIYGNFFSDLGSGGRKIINKKALKMTSKTGRFQSFFGAFFFKISPEKTVKLGK